MWDLEKLNFDLKYYFFLYYNVYENVILLIVDCIFLIIISKENGSICLGIFRCGLDG